LRLVVTGGGTGGHIYPALSVAALLDGDQIDFIGSASGPEANIVPRAGYRFHAIRARKMSRRVGLGTLAALATAVLGLTDAVRLLRRLRPDAVLGTGGYVSGPVMLGAALLRIPAMLLEGNSIPGRTNRLLARLVQRVGVTFSESRRYFPTARTVLTGFPIRGEIGAGNPERARAYFNLDQRAVVFVFGGSSGAESINRAVADALPLLADSGVQVLHQTGHAAAGASGGIAESSTAEPGASECVESGPNWYHPIAYVEAMGDALAASELVVCRAGASTLAEVTAAGRPAILVPYPYAHADHQTRNGQSLVVAGAARLIPDAEATGARLAAEITAILRDADGRRTMADASRRLGKPDAARRVLDELSQLAGKGRVGEWDRGRAAA
jgi:UDP-N-acetylglucosamine--N-acetylmuramyl-(pentapeptide) pyrophosphoryl-undecaprenol N-acetylglucosamine transferase